MEKIQQLISGGMLLETEVDYKVTEKGKCYIDNIYYFLLEEQEKNIIDKQIRILSIQ